MLQVGKNILEEQFGHISFSYELSELLLQKSLFLPIM